ncbi:hypothetical protein [Wolbachia endosymbiont (group A) of Myopa testacea]|uniref:hypothetical protein n=1 Tax=Wolbachia endosymbiont (group A) of Myopa testacea TaxID=3066148 RepID=UPI00334038FD
MKKLLTLIAMLPAISLSGACFGVDSIEEDKIFYTVTTHGSTRFLSFAYALGYHYTNSTQVSIGPIFSFSSLAAGETRIGILSGLRYHYDIKDIGIAPYINANLGILSSGFSDYNLAYRISSGVDFPISPKASLSVGYYLERGLLSRGYLHGLEVGVNFNF